MVGGAETSAPRQVRGGYRILNKEYRQSYAFFNAVITPCSMLSSCSLGWERVKMVRRLRRVSGRSSGVRKKPR